MLDNGQRYTPEKAWETIYHAMNEAKHFIYVAEWSVNATVALLLLRRVLQRLPERLGQSLEEHPVRRRLLLLTDHTSLPAETMHTRSRKPSPPCRQSCRPRPSPRLQTQLAKPSRHGIRLLHKPHKHSTATRPKHICA
jgi:hypothetical protein